MIHAENEALEALRRICRNRVHIIIVADCGFGNQRRVSQVKQQGFHFVQRVSGVFSAEVEKYIGTLSGMNLRRGKRIRDWVPVSWEKTGSSQDGS